jgi:hypothetical protein
VANDAKGEQQLIWEVSGGEVISLRVIFASAIIVFYFELTSS